MVKYINSDKLVKVRQNGVYEDAEGVRHFLKVGRVMPANYKLVDQVDSLGERTEVAEAESDTKADTKADSEPENKAEKAPARKA